MKKLLFSALACVAFAGSSFAANEIVVENQHEIEVKEGFLIKNNYTFESVNSTNNCFVRVDVYDSRGRFVRSHYFSTTTTSEADCADYATSCRMLVNMVYNDGGLSL